MKNELLEKYLNGDVSASENELIGKWLSENPDRVNDLSTMRNLHEAMLWKQSACKTHQTITRSKPQSIFRQHLFRVAAFIIALLTVGNIILLNNLRETPKAKMQTLYVPAGQRAKLILSDGTKVWLNALSTLTFPSEFEKETRQVVLIGEGFFDVTPNKNQPFMVHTPKYNIKVLGTKFNVSSYSQTNYFETSLLEGSVEILDSKSRLQAILKPGTKAIAYNNEKFQKSNIDNYDYYLWRDGLICFDEITIDKLFKKLEIYYDIQIVVNNQSIMKQKFTGKLRMSDGINHALEVIRTHTPFNYIRNEDENVITIR